MKQLICNIFIIFLSAINVLTSQAADASALETASPQGKEYITVYECAANCLYSISRLSDVDVTYEKCVELLPISPAGNSMLELKRALETFGFTVGGYKIDLFELQLINAPAIIYLDNPQERKIGEVDSHIAHFAVYWPLGDGKVLIFDYPEKPRIYPVNSLIEHFEKLDIKELTLLVCNSEKDLERVLGKTNARPRKKPSRDISVNKFTEIFIGPDLSSNQIIPCDFGEKPEGSEVVHYFHLRNKLKRPVHITRLIRGCSSCLELTTDKEELSPGDRAVITFKVSLDGRTGKQFITGGLVFSEEDKIPPIQIQFRGTAQPRWLPETQYIEVGKIPQDDELITKEVTIHTTKFGKDFTLSHAESTSKMIVAKLEQKSDSNYMLTVEMVPGNFLGKFSDIINIYASEQKSAVMQCKVEGEIITEIVLRPKRLFLDKQNTPMGKLHMKHQTGKKIEIGSISVSKMQDIAVESHPEWVKDKEQLSLAINMFNIDCNLFSGYLDIKINLVEDDNSLLLKAPFVYSDAVN